MCRRLRALLALTSSSLGGKYRCIITNLEEPSLVDMLETRNKVPVM